MSYVEGAPRTPWTDRQKKTRNSVRIISIDRILSEGCGYERFPSDRSQLGCCNHSGVEEVKERLLKLKSISGSIHVTMKTLY